MAAAAADGWCSLVQAAAALDCSPDTVRRRVGRGELRGRRVPTPHGLAWQVCLDGAAAPPQAAGEGGQQAADGGQPVAEPAELASAALVGLVERLSTANAALSEELGYLRARVELLEGLRLLAPPTDSPVRPPWWRRWRGG